VFEISNMVDLVKKVELASSIGNFDIAIKTVKEIIKGKLSESDREIFESTFKDLLAVKTDMRSSLTETIADEASSEAKKKAAVALQDDINGEIKAVCSEVFVSSRSNI
jgi:hypothetical protein